MLRLNPCMNSLLSTVGLCVFLFEEVQVLSIHLTNKAPANSNLTPWFVCPSHRVSLCWLASSSPFVETPVGADQTTSRKLLFPSLNKKKKSGSFCCLHQRSAAVLEKVLFMRPPLKQERSFYIRRGTDWCFSVEDWYRCCLMISRESLRTCREKNKNKKAVWESSSKII